MHLIGTIFNFELILFGAQNKVPMLIVVRECVTSVMVWFIYVVLIVFVEQWTSITQGS